MPAAVKTPAWRPRGKLDDHDSHVGKFRDCIRAVAKLTSDDELRRVAELPEVPVSLENCRQLDPQTRFVMVCRLDVSPAETPRWRRIQPTGLSPDHSAEMIRNAIGWRGSAGT